MRTVKGPGFFDWLAIKKEERAAKKERTVKCPYCRYTTAYLPSEVRVDDYEYTVVTCSNCDKDITLG